jgi:hypothetical protein
MSDNLDRYKCKECGLLKRNVTRWMEVAEGDLCHCDDFDSWHDKWLGESWKP